MKTRSEKVEEIIKKISSDPTYIDRIEKSREESAKYRKYMQETIDSIKDVKLKESAKR